METYFNSRVCSLASQGQLSVNIPTCEFKAVTEMISQVMSKAQYFYRK